jgi:dipeptidyl aminopeptidase/acylaminoacyl peptidase
MVFTRIAAFAAAASVCVGLAWGQPPVEAFASLPFMTDPQLSPDGKHFAAVQSVDGKPVAVVYQVNAPAGARPQVVGFDDWPVVSVRWLKNDRVEIVTKTAKAPMWLTRADFYTFYRSLSLQVGDNGDWVQLFSNMSGAADGNLSTAGVADKDLDDETTVFMPLYAPGAAGGETRLRLFRVDTRTGVGTVEQDGGTGTGQWIMDGNGHVVARVDNSFEPRVRHLMLYKNGGFHEVQRYDGEVDSGNGVAGLTLDGKALVTWGRTDGHDALQRFDLESEKPGGTLFADPHYDVAYTLSDEWTYRIDGASYMADKMEYVYFDPSRAALQRGIEAVFPGKDAHAVSVTRDGKHAIVVVAAPDTPPTYYFLDRDTHAATRIASEYPGLTAADLGTEAPYPYKARDGLDIPAYLTLPPGKASAKGLPLVVMPHGGPDGRDGIGFDWWAQFLANRGYAVFQPNYRGSSGYGLAFTQAGLHQWGLKMQDDITDGVKKLIADGTADPKRICIVGASYGGYAALAGATFTPDLYACAASISGVSNLGRMMNREKMVNGRRSGAVAFWDTRIGDDSAQQDATSPALHADQVRAPILLMHGRHDTTVPYNQSEMERDALQTAGKTVTLVTFDDDDHYMTLASTRLQMLTALERFLAANIGR